VLYATYCSVSAIQVTNVYHSFVKSPAKVPTYVLPFFLLYMVPYLCFQTRQVVGCNSGAIFRTFNLWCHLSMLHIGQSIYQRNYDDNTWTKLPGAAVWAAAGIDYSIWCCNAAQEIFRWNATKSGWDKMPGACVQVYIFFFVWFTCSCTFLFLSLLDWRMDSW